MKKRREEEDKTRGTSRGKPLNNTRKARIACSLVLFIKFIKLRMGAEVAG